MIRNGRNRKFSASRRSNLMKPDWLKMLRRIKAVKARNDATLDQLENLINNSMQIELEEIQMEGFE